MSNAAMKRGRDEGEIEMSLDMANCLMLLSKVGETKPSRELEARGAFKCKTCNREFSSFQALGGHRASHKKPKLMGADLSYQLPSSTKMHPCPICGVEFAIGQALGGHMRKHRASTNDGFASHAVKEPLPVLNKPNNKRTCLCLDLNLTPLENDLKLNLRTPVVSCFI